MTGYADQPIWQRLGFPHKVMESFAEGLQYNQDLWLGQPPDNPDGVDLWATIGLNRCLFIYHAGVIGYDLAEPFSDWRVFGRRLSKDAMYYFFGKWRDQFTYLTTPMDRSSARKRLPWIDRYRAGLSGAAAFSDWKSFDNLLQWIDMDLRFDTGVDDLTPQDDSYQRWLAFRLRNEPEKVAAPLHADVEKHSRRRPKLAMAAADALFAGDTVGLSKSLTELLRLYKKSDLDLTVPVTAISLDATVLWHLARRHGLGEIPLPDDLSIMIAKP